ncbi:related to arsenic resistance protein ArsH [Fusarium fujikuroi]|nr:related to arsenic resistance protein ArsH [Fusarium fujikuroi]
MNGHGDLNNSHAGRTTVEPIPDPGYAYHSLAIDPSEDVSEVREKYRPFILDDKWLRRGILDKGLDRLRILVLYGSLRSRSYSRLLAFEAARTLHRLGCDVRVYNPAGLSQKDDIQHDHPKVQELRELSKWSDGHVWISPEQHGNLIGSPSQQAPSVQPKAEPSPSLKSAAAHNPSMPSILYVFLDDILKIIFIVSIDNPKNLIEPSAFIHHVLLIIELLIVTM